MDTELRAAITGHSSSAAPRAYSYVRFSTPEQMKGDSLRRQTQRAEAYARAHGLTLDAELTFRDLGTSAYRGRNAEVGRLRDFLVAVETRLVPPGSFLLVENLDRISRQAARKALRVLEEIVEAGITLVTLDDGRVYTSDNLDNDPIALVLALLTFIRANEESSRKSSLIKASWEAKRAKARAIPGAELLTARGPAWLEFDNLSNRFRVIEERAAIVRRIFELLDQGVGLHKIAWTLNQEGVPTFGDRATGRRASMWHRSYVKKIAHNPAVIGIVVPHSVEYHRHNDRVRKVRRPLDPITDYFPAVVPEELFHRVQALCQTGRRSPTARGTGIVRSILAGLATCPHCRSTMTRVTKGSASKSGRPYLVCVRAKAGAGCAYVAVPIEIVEQALGWGMRRLAKSVPSQNTAHEREIDDLSRELTRRVSVRRNLTDAIAEQPSTTLSKELAEAEAACDEIQAQLHEAMDRAASSAPAALRERMEELCTLMASPVLEVGRINSRLRQCFQSVVVDFDAGALRATWKNGRETPIPLLPRQRGKSGAVPPSWLSPNGSLRPVRYHRDVLDRTAFMPDMIPSVPIGLWRRPKQKRPKRAG
jgi:DNA invertase Pin-like site-specific DNA recombinase